MRRLTFFSLFLLLGWLLPLAALVRADEGSVDYLRDIRPLLKARCYACHGALKQNSSMRLDTAASLIRGGDSGPAIVPGHSDESLLIEAVTGDLAVWRMPPEGEALTPQQIALLRRWIDQGAPHPEDEQPEPDPRVHWAFQSPIRPEVPRVHHTARVKNPIDAFLAAEHERLGLQPAPPAEKQVLLRRVYLDLVGLPPTREEARTFLADSRADAYEQLVGRLLNSPDFGQRWGRHWLDIWRYSDWSGENKNLVRGSPKHIWRWRDWIVASLNEGKTYDRMITEMLAGDEIAPDDPDVVRATGFLARNWYEFNRNVWLDDTVEHTAKAFLGLTLACARCHDHKFDPVSQQEYYAWRAIFEPHDVRIDPIPGEPDTDVAGLPRVFDARSDTPTYLFIRGEETRPDKEHAIAPTVPAMLGGRFEIQPISFPLEIAYPAMQPGACEEMIRRAEAEVSAAQTALTAAQSGHQPAEGAVQLAEKRLVAVQAELDSITARVAAERVRYGVAVVGQASGLPDQARVAAEHVKHAAAVDSTAGEGDSADTSSYDRLASAAAAADRLAALRKAELSVFESEQKLAKVRASKEVAEGGKKAKAALSDVEKEMNAARKGLAAAEAAISRTDAKYSSLGPQYPQSSTGRRLALAHWITDPRNPLTARVAVNHVWMRHFGEPLVDPVDDFGRRTARPRHLALLDWLAVEFVESGWDLKYLHRLMLTSNAYQMASLSRDVLAANEKIDRENRYLWRMNSRRAEGEVIRDSILHVSGNLDHTLGGPEIPLEEAETARRRSLYFRHAHERKTPFLEIFDSADVLECYRRSTTVVPQQALALANSLLPYVESRRLARALTAESAGQADADFVRLAFEHVLTRQPTPAELDRCLAFLKEPAPAAQPGDDSTLHARAGVIHALMNHSDFITIR